MAQIAISVQDKPLFIWDGGEDEILRILEKFPETAKGIGVEPQVLAQSFVFWLRKGRLSKKPSTQQMQMMGIIWLILTTDTHDADHPGPIGVYAPNTDFVANFEIDNNKHFTIHIDATSKFHS
jgi:hypothetical protein